MLTEAADTCYEGVNEIPCISCPKKPEGSMFMIVRLWRHYLLISLQCLEALLYLFIINHFLLVRQLMDDGSDQLCLYLTFYAFFQHQLLPSCV